MASMPLVSVVAACCRAVPSRFLAASSTCVAVAESVRACSMTRDAVALSDRPPAASAASTATTTIVMTTGAMRRRLPPPPWWWEPEPWDPWEP